MRNRRRGRMSWAALRGDEWLSFQGFWSPPEDGETPRWGPWLSWRTYLADWREMREEYLATRRPGVPLAFAEEVYQQYGAAGPEAER